ncbi:hypothetical protein KORDIASMS9_02067 [Kordia sp. SMS9]|uniref:hypothetical protein n=1 Tax=Kordia sp. SMS9 TaxID=2282170 RepID=UPI000E1022DD|nr:hypothetical protein [Kordia sp. SMS9]AXG69839.1 hypothetical protein KORDIASMS9_02067 [Kordia sp. SMS9]
MKHLNIYMSLCVILVTMSMNSQNQSKEIREVAEKGKADLVQILTETGDQFNFGIDANDVKNARIASPLNYYEMNFEKLLNYNDSRKMEDLLNAEIKKIIPLIKDTKLITTIGVAKQEKEGKFKVIELIDHQYHKALNQLPNSMKREEYRNLKIVYVPNLNVNIYHLNGKNYTSYKGRELSTPIDDARLLKMLQNDAKIFQSKFGDQVKGNKLLN